MPGEDSHKNKPHQKGNGGFCSGFSDDLVCVPCAGTTTVLITDYAQHHIARKSLPRASTWSSTGPFVTVCFLFVFAALMEYATLNYYSSCRKPPTTKKKHRWVPVAKIFSEGSRRIFLGKWFLFIRILYMIYIVNLRRLLKTR